MLITCVKGSKREEGQLALDVGSQPEHVVTNERPKLCMRVLMNLLILEMWKPATV